MNAAAQRIRRAHLIEILRALVDQRAELTDEIFEYQLEENAAKVRRNNIDTQIAIASYELTLLTEGFKCHHSTNSAKSLQKSTTSS